MRYPEKSPLPPPLPPERRTVGQLIAESIKLYQHHFWLALVLGLATVPSDVLSIVLGADGKATAHAAFENAVVGYATQVPLFSAAYVGASLLVVGSQPRGRILRAYLLAVLIYLPVPVLTAVYLLPALGWLALAGLAVPALLAEGGGMRHAFGRGVELARVDYVHVLGGICALVILVLVTRGALAAVLHSQGGNAARTARVIADVVLFPLIFIGSALLYVDQEARVRVRGAEAPVVA